MATQRKTNFEALRCICAVMIVAGHITGETDIFRGGVAHRLFLALMSSGARIAVSTFIMIGAWFLVDSHFKFERIVRIWLETAFYAVSLSLISKFFLRLNVSTSDLVKAALPFCGHVLWFPCVYMGMLICSPFLNQIICLCAKRWLQYILLVNLFLLSFIPTIVPGNSGLFFNEFNWFLFIYIFIGYYKRYGINIVEKKVVYLSLSIGLYCFLASLWVIFSIYKNKIGYLNRMESYYIHDLETLPAFLCSVGLFVWFKNIKIQYNRWINMCASSTFAVYIIHQVPIFYEYLWNDLFAFERFASEKYFFAYFILAVAMIFIVCVIVDQIRLKLEQMLLSGNYSKR